MFDQTNTLTTGNDTGTAFTGDAGEDVYSAEVDTANTLHTLSTFDELDGGDGDDTLEIYLDAAVTALTAAPEIQNIEFIKLYASATTTVLDLSSADITGLEEIALVRITAATADVTVTVDDFTGVAIALDRVSDGTFTFIANDDNDSTIVISATSSGEAATAAVLEFTASTAGATVDTISLTVAGDNVLDLSSTATLAAVTAIAISGTGSLDDLGSSTGFTALVSVDASDLEGDLTLDISGSTALTSVLGGAGADSLLIDVTDDVTVDLGAGDDTLDITASTGVLDANDSLAGGAGTLDILVIDVADLSAVTDDIVSGFEVIALGASTVASITGTIDFDDLSSDVIGLKFAGATAASIAIDNADGKTIFINSSITTSLTINDDTTSDTVAIEIDTADTAVALTTTTLTDIEEITIAAISDATNSLTFGDLTITGSDTVELSFADGDTGGGVSAGTVSVTSGDLVIDISSDAVVVAAVSASGADTVEINVTGDSVAITALTSNAADVSISLSGDTNTIGTATLSGVTTLTIASAGDGNEVTTALQAAALTDLTLEITGGDFTLVSGTASVLLEAITISGAGDVTSVVVDAASTAFETLDLSDFTGEIAATSGIDLSAVTTGVDVTFGELTGATAAAATGQLLLGATNAVSDTIEFTVDFDGFIMIANFEGGGNILDDNIDLSAFGLNGTSDLTITDDTTDTTIVAANDEFSFSIVLTGVTSAALAGSDFIF